VKRWINGHKLRAVWTRAGADAAISRAHPNSPIYMLEEEDMQRVSPPESDQEAYERNERIGTAAWAEVARLKPIVSRPLGEPVPVEEPLEPYITYQAWPLRREGGQHVGTPSTGVLAVHSSGIAAVSTDERSQMANKEAATERVRQLVDSRRIGDLLTPDEWGALNALGVCLEENHVYQLIDATSATGQRNRGLVRSAIAKLFAANAGRVR